MPHGVMKRTKSAVFFAACSVLVFLMWWDRSDERLRSGYGSVTGQFVLQGNPLPPRLILRKRDLGLLAREACVPEEIFSDDFIVDEATRGIANIFVYLPHAKTVHPRFRESEVKEVTVRMKNCRFEPRAMFVQTDQIVRLASSDDCAHDVAILDSGPHFGRTMQPNYSGRGWPIRFTRPEKHPFEINCDVHKWMLGYWLVLDHPYAAVTDATGRFAIPDLPVGSYDFKVWHEKAGYLSRGLRVTVSADQKTDLGVIEVPVAKFSNDAR
jgi:hypothetical protein